MKSEAISHLDAIEIVGKHMFRVEWIGVLSDEEKDIIEKFGPKAASRGGVTIDPCPADCIAQLDRALSRRERLNPQRGAAVDWLLERGLLDLGDWSCDRAGLTEALAGGAPKRGAPPKFEALAIRMRLEVDRGERTWESIREGLGKNSQSWYGVDRKTARRALKQAV